MKFDRISARYLLALIVLINLGLTIGTIRRRQPEVDEALFANPAYNLATKGTFGTDIIDTVELAKTGLNMD
jgi:hypothetical protein